MVNFRHRIKRKTKGKRWKKGQSSSSNPEARKYRDIAKNNFFQDNSGAGNLTSDALKKHNELLGVKSLNADEVDNAEDDGEITCGGTQKTFKTFASNWSECSNLSFSKLLQGFSSDSAIHKEMLAILAAVTEVIKANGGKESSVEYLAALLTTLDSCDSEDSLVGVLQLIGMVIKNVPQSVLKLKYALMSKTFVNFLGQFSESDNNALMRSLIGCISVLLRAQESALWSNPSTLQTFDSILIFTTHSKPKIRKAAQHAVSAVLKGSSFMLGENALLHHPAASHVAQYMIKQIESGSTLGGSTTTLHTLGLLKEILSTFPKTQLKAACENILKIMTLGNMLVTSSGMQTLHGLFISRPSTSSLTPRLNAQLITALFDYQPSPTDTQPTLAWLAVMQEAYINLARSDLGLCFANLTRLFTAVVQLLLSNKPEVTNGATLTLKAVIEDCVSPACSAELVNTHKYTLSKLFEIIEVGLTYQYHSAWHQVLHILAVWFKIAGEACKDFMIPCLKLLGELRDSYKFSNVNELEFAVGQAVLHLGPEIVLNAIPLEITGEEKNYDFKRSWLLPVLKKNIQSSQLHFYLKYFLPLATLCKKQSSIMSAHNDSISAHSFDLLQSQIWSLLPCFCNNPTDLKDSFKTVAKILGVALGEFKNLRLDTMLALRKLITSSQIAGNEDNIKEMARFAKNYLPILFNLYTTKPVGSEEDGQRLAAYETIKVYLQIADENLCLELFDRAIEKLDMEDVEQFLKESIFDLLRALVSYQDSSRIKKLFSYCEQNINSLKNCHEQKKIYKVLEELCSCSSERCESFFVDNMLTIQNLLIDSLSTAATPCRGPRLKCLSHLVKRLGKSQLEVLKQIVPEAVLCCKDTNERCRTAAYNLLVEIGQVMQKWSDASQEDLIREYMGLLMAGLAGKPSLMSATILALAKVNYEFRDYIPEDLVQLMLENVCLLLKIRTREVVCSAASFIKMFITSFSYDVVTKNVRLIVSSIVEMTKDCKHHFRRIVHDILDRLGRKYGYDVLSSIVPKSDVVTLKVLNNMRKTQARKKKQRSVDDDGDDNENEEDMFKIKSEPKSIEDILAELDDSDLEEDPEPKVKSKKQKKTTTKTWIEEDEENIVDFTDVSAMQKIRTTDPKTTQNTTVKRKESSDFKLAPDGRLIIRDLSDDDDDDNISFKNKKSMDIDSDSSDEENLDNSQTAGRKRKLSVSTDASQPAMKYQVGGSGIHRPLKQSKSTASGSGFSGAEYKAKKAKGDVKKKGKPDPYAYVPLSHKVLNRRKKKQKGQFANICRAAHKGAKKGTKFRKKNGSKRN